MSVENPVLESFWYDLFIVNDYNSRFRHVVVKTETVKGRIFCLSFFQVHDCGG